MEYYSMTNEQREENADFIKTVIISALVKDGLLTEEEADEWAETHTIIVRRKSFFRTLTDKWREEKVEKNKECWLVVGKP